MAKPLRSKVAIIILNYNGRKSLGDFLDKAIESAINQSYPYVDVVFVDNGSTDDSIEYVESRWGGRVKIIKLGRNYGFCLGNNIAVKLVGRNYDYILFQNTDVILSRDYVEKLVEFMESRRDVATVQGIEVSPTGRKMGSLITLRGLHPRDVPPLDRPTPILYAVGAAMLVRRDIFERVGGFSSEFFAFFDELDLSLRLWALGYKVYGVPLTSYYHLVAGVTSKMGLIPLYFYNRNRLLIIIRYFHSKYFIIALVLTLFLILRGMISRRNTTRLFLRLLHYVVKNLRRELSIRLAWRSLITKRWNIISRMISRH